MSVLFFVVVYLARFIVAVVVVVVAVFGLQLSGVASPVCRFFSFQFLRYTFLFSLPSTTSQEKMPSLSRNPK